MRREISVDPKEKLEVLAEIQTLISRLYRYPLTEEMAVHFADLDTEDATDFLMKNDSCKQGSDLMKTFCSGADTATLLQQASDDFHFLFIGPDALGAAPWSSVYLDPKGLIFGATEQAVEEQFKRFGLASPAGHREPCDHIAYEFDFESDLIGRSLAAQETGDEDSALSYLRAAQSFFTSYMTSWVGLFCTRVNKAARYDFYRGLALFTAGVMEIQEDTLSQPA